MKLNQLDALHWLISRYKEQCYGFWRYTYGIKIDTVDNPGWDIFFDIKESLFGRIDLTYRSTLWDDNNWYGYTIKNCVFNGYGDPDKLEILINAFRSLWEQYVDKVPAETIHEYPHSDTLGWLMQWYKDRCNGVWEHSYGITIKTLDNPGWEVTIELQETILETVICDFASDTNADNDWYRYKIEDGIFYASGDPDKLVLLIKCFKQLWEEHTQSIDK